MRILVFGGGGREHALAWWCRRGPDDVELIVAPGNAGTADIAENVAVDVTDAATLARRAHERAVDLVVIGPDAAAAARVADACVDAGIVVFGPTAQAALPFVVGRAWHAPVPTTVTEPRHTWSEHMARRVPRGEPLPLRYVVQRIQAMSGSTPCRRHGCVPGPPSRNGQ